MFKGMNKFVISNTTDVATIFRMIQKHYQLYNDYERTGLMSFNPVKTHPILFENTTKNYDSVYGYIQGY